MDVTYYQNNNQFQKSFIKALLAHILLVVLFYLSGVLNLNIFHKEIEIEENIQSAVKVDIVGMPKLTVQELKQFKASDTQKGEQLEEKVEEPVQKKVEESSVDLGSILTNLSKKKIKRKKAIRKKFGDEISEKELKSLVQEGNKLSQGEAVVGDSLSESRSIFAQYVSRIPSHVRPFWKLPSYLLEKELSCRIRVYINSDGKVLRSELIKSSGVDEYDNRALRAIKQSNPFPKPAKEIVSFLAEGKVVLGFPL